MLLIDVTLVIIVLSIVARIAKLLTTTGAFAAVFVGVCALYVGGVYSLVLLTLFFVGSNAVGFWRKRHKQSLHFEKSGSRDHWQVLANGGPATIGLIFGHFAALHHTVTSPSLALYAAGLAEANADTWATEIGSACRARTWSILSGNIVRSGESGGVSVPGTIAGAVGSIVIAAAFYLLNPETSIRVASTVALAGLSGAIIDSVLGATVQAQFENEGRTIETPTAGSTPIRGWIWFRNDAVNFTAGAAAVIVAALILLRQ